MGDGQDWASYQGPSPSAAGLDFVGVKVTEGIGYANPYWRVQLGIVRAAGAVPVLYHYPHMGNGVTSEVAHFRSVLGPDLHPGDVLALDWEGYDAANAHLTMADQIRYKDAFLAQLQAAEPAHQVGTYANVDYLNHDPSGHYGDFLWIATAGRPKGSPGITHPWTFHQWSADQVDRDYTPMTRAELIAWAAEKETDMPLTPADAQLVASTLLNTKLTSPVRKDAAGQPAQISVAAYFEWLDVHYDATTAQIGALTELVKTLAASGGSLTPAQAEAASKAGAAAALAELGTSLEHLVPAQAPAAAEAPAKSA